MDSRNRDAGMPLGPELAKINPEAYQSLLISELQKDSVYGAEALKLALASGHFSKLNLNTDSCVSSSRGNELTIGVQPLPEQTKKQLIFLDQEFNYGKEVAYRLLHEVTHIVAYLASNQDTESARSYANLSSAFEDLRKNGKGLTPLGGLDFYKAQGSGVQAVEDIVELTTMYLWNPEYLRNFLNFLSNPQYKQARQIIGVSEITQNTERSILEIISKCTKTLLSK